MELEEIQDVVEAGGYLDHQALDKALDKYIQEKSKEDFLTFVRRVAPTLVTDFKMGRHIELLCDRLQKVADGEIKRLMVFPATTLKQIAYY